MQPEHVLPAVIAVWCVAFFVRLFVQVRRGAEAPVGWTVKTAVALAGVGAAAFSGSDVAIYGVSGAWAIFLLVPILAAQAQQRALMAGRPDRAGTWAKIVRALHPFDGWRQTPGVMDALSRAKTGDRSAIDDLRGLASSPELPPAMRPYLRSEIARLTDDWEGFLATLQGPLPVGLEALPLRAMGETGRLDALVAEHARLDAARPPDAFADLMLLVFAGRSRALAVLIDSAVFGNLNDTAKNFWRATARLAGAPGDPEARRLLETTFVGPQSLSSAARRFAGDLGRPDALDAQARAHVDRVERRVVADMGRMGAGRARRALVTSLLVAANVAAFGAELIRGGLDGPTDLETLFELGALWPPAVVQDGEWWRLGTALFLHFGVLHLALNMLALAVFGRLVERGLGHVRMLVLYAVAGLGSMAFVLALARFGDGEPQLLVGASGAIFGVVGALVALFGSDAIAGSRAARRRLVEIAMIVALQVGFDLMTPEVSFSAHAGGFAVGLIAGSMLMRRVQRPT